MIVWLKSHWKVLVYILAFVILLLSAYLLLNGLHPEKSLQTDKHLNEVRQKQSTPTTETKGDTKDKPEVKKPWYKSLGWIIGIVFSFVVVIVIAVMFLMFQRARAARTGNQDSPKETDEENPPSKGWRSFWLMVWEFLKHPATAILLGCLAMINWLTWALSPNFWLSLWKNPGRFWAINVGLWLAIALLIKIENKIVKKLLAVVLLMVFAIIGMAIYDYNKINVVDKPKVFDEYWAKQNSESNLLVINAPTNTFSEEVIVPLGFNANWGESEDSFIVKNDRGLEAKYDRVRGIFENLPPPSSKLRFQSLNSKTAVVKLRLKKM
jgi:hypothetical protein